MKRTAPFIALALFAPLCMSEGVSLSVSVDLAQQRAPAAAFSDGRLFAVWQDARDGGKLFGQAYDADGSPLWEENGRPLVSAAGNQGTPAVAPDGSGGFFLVWLSMPNLQRDLYAQRFNKEGEPLWETVVVAEHEHPKSDHRIASDGKGGLYIVWEDWRNANLDIYGQRVSASGKILWEANGTALSSTPSNQYDPSVSADENGCVVVWWDVPEIEAWQVYVQRMSPEGKPLWGEGGTRACLNPSGQSSGAVAADGAGGAFVFWVDHRNEASPQGDALMNLDIYVQQFDPSGKRLLSEEGRALCEAPGTQIEVAALPDGNGGAYAVWTDLRDHYEDIYAQRVLPDGSAAWQANGAPVCIEGGRQRSPRIAPAADGFWIAWYDYRRELEEQTYQDVYMQRMRADGTTARQEGGLPIAVRPGQRIELSVCAGKSGAAAFWAEQPDEFSGMDIRGWVSQPRSAAQNKE